MRMGLPRYWVNTGALSLVASDTDFAYSGLGPQISMTHTYNSNDTTSGMFGRGWAFSYDVDVAASLCGVTSAVLHRADGSFISFGKTSAVCSGGASNLQVALSPTYPPDNRDKMTYFYRASDKTDYWVHESKSDFTKSSFDFLLSGPTPSWLLSSITDRNGNAVLISRDSEGKISTVTDAAGRATSFTYDANGRCASMMAPNGKTASYSYDSSGYLTETVDVAGNHTLYTYDTDGYMTGMTVGGKTATFTYDATVTPKRLATVTDAMGNTQSYQKAYSPGNVAVDPLGNKSYYANVSDSSLCSPAGTGTQDALGFTTQKVYTGGLLTSYTDSLGLARSLTYDTRGNLTSYQTRPGYQATTLTYDANDNPISITTPLGNTYNFEYDGNHNLTTATSPLGNTHSMSYTTGGLLSAVTDPLDNVTSFGYDSFGKLISSMNALGNTWSKTYDDLRILKLSDTDPLGNTTSYAYDDNHRLTGITYADGSQKTFEYDCCSMTGIIDENGNHTVIERNGALKPVSVTDPMGNKTTYSYDATNTLVGVVKPDKSVASVSPDQLYRPSTVTAPLGGTRMMTYDGNWSPASLTDERGKTTTFSSMNGMPWQTTDPLGNTTKTVWDGAKRLLFWENSRGKRIHYGYTSDSRLAWKSESDGDPTLSAQYSYDKAGNLVQIQDSAGATSYTYDAVGRVTGVTYPDTNSAAFSYNGVGRYSSIDYPGGVTATYTYDKRNRVSSVAWGSNWITFSYDPAGNLLSETRSNGTVSSFGYDKRNLVTRITHSKGSSPFSDTSYSRNSLGNVAKETSAVSLLSPLLSKATTSGAYNDANQLVSFGTTTYTHDADGNLTNLSGGSVLSASYNSENRLISITRGGTLTSYTYNGVGHRTKAATGTQATNYYYDKAETLLFQTDAAGQISAYYIYAGKRLVAMGTPTKGYYFFHFDKTGNTAALTDGAGAVAAAYAYAPFGEILNKTGSIANPFTYAGAHGVISEGNGLYFMKNRYYDAVTGRFIQKDPIGFRGGQTNLYAYVNNNPVKDVDPYGLGLFGIIKSFLGFAEETKDYVEQEGKPQTIGDMLEGNKKKGIEAYNPQNEADKMYRLTQSGGKVIEEVDKTILVDAMTEGVHVPGVPGAALKSGIEKTLPEGENEDNSENRSDSASGTESLCSQNE
jgi:RHS repeat-associated protein